LPVLVASVLPKHVEQIGSIAGIVSFVAMLILLGLYIARAIELHRLRKTMPFLVNPTDGNGQPPGRRSRRSRRRVGG
jgi:hypothetical protein